MKLKKSSVSHFDIHLRFGLKIFFSHCAHVVDLSIVHRLYRFVPVTKCAVEWYKRSSDIALRA